MCSGETQSLKLAEEEAQPLTVEHIYAAGPRKGIWCLWTITERPYIF